MRNQLEVGDLARVPGPSASLFCYGHSLPQGAVCRVVWVHPNGDVDLQHPSKSYSQVVRGSLLKKAKQAMRKRDEYAARRG